MKILNIITIIWISICSLVLLVFHIKSGKAIKSIVLNAILGFAAILLINITSRFTGVHVPVNWYTVLGSGILGIPGVCGIVLLQIFI